jgi:hypothetical protein
MVTIYSAPCTNCGGAHVAACGVYLGQIARLLTWIATTGLMVLALIPVVI